MLDNHKQKSFYHHASRFVLTAYPYFFLKLDTALLFFKWDYTQQAKNIGPALALNGYLYGSYMGNP